jgi:hypothetical protein
VGFISGAAFMANYASKRNLEKQAMWPRTKGVLVDTVSQYIDLHPAIWAEESTLGVLTAVNDLSTKQAGQGMSFVDGPCAACSSLDLS